MLKGGYTGGRTISKNNKFKPNKMSLRKKKKLIENNKKCKYSEQ